MEEYVKQLRWERDIALQQLKEIGCELGRDMTDIKIAIEKTQPRRVNNRKIMRDFHNRPYSVKGDCPMCGAPEILSINTDYCHVCGQKLNWNPVNPEKEL